LASTRSETIRLSPPAQSLVAPVLLRLAFNRGRDRVLDLEPVLDPAGAIGRATPLRHDAFAAERASVFEHDRAVDYVVSIEQDAGMLVMDEP
jgi:hypothetical protein